MKTFKWLVLFVTIFFSINISIIAQTENKTESRNLHSFSVYFINGYALGYDYFKTDAFKLRATLDLSLSGEKIDSDGESKNIMYGPTINGSKELGERETDRDDFSISLASQILFPIYKTEYGNIYFGAGPSIGYSKDHNTSVYDSKYYYPDTTTTPSINYSSSENTYLSYNIAANVLLGTEAIISNNISLFAEAHLLAGMRWTDDEWTYKYRSSPTYEEHRKNTDKGSGWFYNFKYARLGVKISI